MPDLQYHQPLFTLLGIEPVVSAERQATIAERERVCGVAFPAAIREWMSIKGISPASLGKLVGDDALHLYTTTSLSLTAPAQPIFATDKRAYSVMAAHQGQRPRGDAGVAQGDDEAEGVAGRVQSRDDDDVGGVGIGHEIGCAGEPPATVAGGVGAQGGGHVGGVVGVPQRGGGRDPTRGQIGQPPTAGLLATEEVHRLGGEHGAVHAHRAQRPPRLT